MLNYVHLSEDEEVTSLVSSTFPRSAPRTVTSNVTRNQSSASVILQALDKKHGCTSPSSAVLWTATDASSPLTGRKQSSPSTVLKITTAVTYVTVPFTSRKQSSIPAVLRTAVSVVYAPITSRNQNHKPCGRHPSLSLERDPQAETEPPTK